MADATKLYNRLDCQKRQAVDDGYGNTVSGPFTTQFSIRAAFRHLRGGESVMASRLQNRQPTIITVRANSQTRQITADWQLVDARNGTVWAVRDVTPTDDRAYIDLLCERGVAS